MVSSRVALYILGVQPPLSGCCPFAGKVSPMMECDGWAGYSKGSGALSKVKTLGKKHSFFLTPSLLGQLSLGRGRETELFIQVPPSRGPNSGKPRRPAEQASDQRPGDSVGSRDGVGVSCPKDGHQAWGTQIKPKNFSWNPAGFAVCR